MARVRDIFHNPIFGIWIYVLKTLRELGGKGTSIDIYMNSKFDFGSNHVAKILGNTSKRGLTIKCEEFKSYKGNRRKYLVHRLTDRGESLLDNRLRYMEVRPHSNFVILGKLEKEIENTGLFTSSLYGQRLVSTWISPLPQRYNMESTPNKVSYVTYADAVMRLVEARAIKAGEKIKQKQYEGDMDPNFIPIQVIHGTTRDTYYVNPVELGVTCDVMDALDFSIEISYWPLEMAGRVISRKDQISLGFILRVEGVEAALIVLYTYHRVLPGEPEAFLDKYGEYLKLLRFSNPPPEQVCSELNTDIYFS